MTMGGEGGGWENWSYTFAQFAQADSRLGSSQAQRRVVKRILEAEVALNLKSSEICLQNLAKKIRRVFSFIFSCGI